MTQNGMSHVEIGKAVRRKRELVFAVVAVELRSTQKVQ